MPRSDALFFKACNYSAFPSILASKQEPIKNLERGYQNAFAKRSKFPKFKSRHKHMSFAYPQGIKVNGKRVYLPKIGWIGFYESREVEGDIKSATISKQASSWYISILCEVEAPQCGNVPLNESNTVGIDLGLIDFLVASDGTSVPTPKFYRKAPKQFPHAQHTLSRRKKGSHRRKRQQQKVARLHEKVAS